VEQFVCRTAPSPKLPISAKIPHPNRSALRAAKERGRSEFGAANDAEAAYRRVMPPLSGAENIRDFVACVAHGMILGAFTGPTGARLLYAAQVAHTTQSAIAPKKRIRNRSKELADADPGNA